MTPPPNKHVVATDKPHDRTLSQAPARATEFERLTTAHVEQYRPPVGALVHPSTVEVADPTAYGDPTSRAVEVAAAHATLKRMNQYAIFLMVGMVALSFVGMITPLFVADMLTGGDPNRWWLLAMSLLLGTAPVAPALFLAGKIDEADKGPRQVLSGPTVTVPEDVGAAYLAYRAVPQQLRAASAAETTVAVIEAQVPYVEDLLVEAARLHRLDGSASVDGLAVRDQMVSLAAQAQSLVVLAQRHQSAILDADASTALVLGRGPDPQTMAQVAEQMVDETTWVRNILDA